MCDHQGYWFVIFHSCSVLSWLFCESSAGLIKWAWKFALLFSFGEQFARISVLLWMLGGIQLWNHLFLDFSFWGIFWFLIKSAYSFSVQFFFFFIIQVIYPLIPGYPICWYKIIYNSLYGPSIFVISAVKSSLSFIILFICILFFIE